MNVYVLDACALIAYLNQEEEADEKISFRYRYRNE